MHVGDRPSHHSAKELRIKQLHEVELKIMVHLGCQWTFGERWVMMLKWEVGSRGKEEVKMRE